MRVPAVDPAKSRPVRRGLVEPLARSGPGRWYLIRVAPALDRLGLRYTGGRLTSLPGAPVVFLTHTGARSGKARTTPLLYFTDGEDVILIASNYGRESHPAWLHNLRANPEVELCARGRRGRYRARVTDGADRERLWADAQRLTAVYGDYEERSGRDIQVVRLSPLDP